MPLHRRALGLRVRHQMSGENGAISGANEDGARFPDACMRHSCNVAIMDLLMRRWAAKDSISMNESLGEN
ncbi:DNA-binding NarL/FixJ family response regulator [Nitrobacteraceae bacterium AZCC 2146]